MRIEIEEHIVPVGQPDDERPHELPAIDFEHVGKHACRFALTRQVAGPDHAHRVGLRRIEAGRVERLPDGGQLIVEPLAEHAAH
ncbi:MAG TPA: hypothetical protein VFU81_17605, partial [Thermomicrobiales bacterium]|nr:hypothetical protein [Thermomicrobiales bacterium]